MRDPVLADELVSMAEEQFAAQLPIAELLENDPAFAAWAERAVTVRVPLPLAAWDEGEPPRQLVEVWNLLDHQDLRLAAIIDSAGWPGRSLVGEDGADAAWAIAQHADRHQDVRRSWVPLIAEAVKSAEADPRHLSRLTDRVSMVDGRPQQYGTYAHRLENGEIEWDIPGDGTVEEIDARRRAIGLPPLAEDLAEPPGVAPYRYLRKTAAFAWPRP
jgi:hypothetical protein